MIPPPQKKTKQIKSGVKKCDYRTDRRRKKSDHLHKFKYFNYESNANILWLPSIYARFQKPNVPYYYCPPDKEPQVGYRIRVKYNRY